MMKKKVSHKNLKRGSQQIEREILGKLGTARIRDQSQGSADGENNYGVFEIFCYKAPLILWRKLFKAIRYCPPHKLPAAIMHQKGKEYADALVVMRLKDFVDHFGK